MTDERRDDASDPRRELAELVASVRAYAEWQADTGADGFPRASAPFVAPAPATQAHPVVSQAAPTPATFAAPRRAPVVAVGPAPFVAPAPVITAAPVVADPPPAVTLRSPAVPVSPASPVSSPISPRVEALPSSAPVSSGSPASSGSDERITRLALLAEEVRSCTACVLHTDRTQTVFSRGDPFAELVFIGEGPGADEDATGVPFVGPAGQLLDRMIAAMGYGRDDVYVCNIVKCRPPRNRKPEMDEMASCMPYLTQQIGQVRPRVIVALGATAVQGLCGTTEGITRLRGKWKLWKGATPIMPTFHPAYLLRNPAAKREVWLDLQEVMKHLGKGPKS